VLQVEQTLRSLPKLDSSSESNDIRDYYDLCARVVQQQQSIIRTAALHQQGSKILGSGRVVMLRDGVSSR